MIMSMCNFDIFKFLFSSIFHKQWIGCAFLRATFAHRCRPVRKPVTVGDTHFRPRYASRLRFCNYAFRLSMHDETVETYTNVYARWFAIISQFIVTASLCTLWRLQMTRYSQVLVHSTVVNSRLSHQYMSISPFL